MKLFKKIKRPIFRFIRTSHISRATQKYARMEAKKAIFTFARYLAYQLSQRPRIRLVASIILSLNIAYLATSYASLYLKAKEPEIKVNGKQILVAADSDLPEVEPANLEAQITGKISPFEFKYPVDGQISQGYKSYHRAFDIAAPNYSPIRSLGNGKVEFTGFTNDGKGNVVIVDHGDGLKSLYAHMSTINVAVGNQVDSETVLGNVGLTGRTTGPHVHLEIYDSGNLINPGSVLPE